MMINVMMDSDPARPSTPSLQLTALMQTNSRNAAIGTYHHQSMYSSPFTNGTQMRIGCSSVKQTAVMTTITTSRNPFFDSLQGNLLASSR